MTIEEIQIGESFRDVRVLSILFRSKYRVRIRGRDWHTRQWNRVGDRGEQKKREELASQRPCYSLSTSDWKSGRASLSSQRKHLWRLTLYEEWKGNYTKAQKVEICTPLTKKSNLCWTQVTRVAKVQPEGNGYEEGGIWRTEA